MSRIIFRCSSWVCIVIASVVLGVSFVSCTDSFAASSDVPGGVKQDIKNTAEIANKLQANQPSPTDINYSLERHNLIRRAYWVNGQREKAQMLPSPIPDMPLGYIILFTDNGSVLGRFIVEGKISSLQSFLNPESEFYAQDGGNYGSRTRWLPDTDGAYGSNDPLGIFFFTPDKKYFEYRGHYLYSDIPFEIKDPVLKIGAR